MKSVLTSLGMVLISLSAKSQLTKGNWLVGGSGNFSSSKNSYSSPVYSNNSDETNVKLSPDIGYFFMDKLALGINPSFSWYKAQVKTLGGLFKY